MLACVPAGSNGGTPHAKSDVAGGAGPRAMPCTYGLLNERRIVDQVTVSFVHNKCECEPEACNSDVGFSYVELSPANMSTSGSSVFSLRKDLPPPKFTAFPNNTILPLC